MSRYSKYFNEHVVDINSSAVTNAGADSFGGGAGAANISQSTHPNITQNNAFNITHTSDATRKRIIQVLELEPATSGISNTTLDFDLADEGAFIQQDSISGTNFSEGKVFLNTTLQDLSEYKSVTPQMSSDASATMNLYYSSQTESRPWWHAFDKVIADIANMGESTSASCWVAVKFSTAKTIGRYSISSRSNSVNWTPRDWTLEGSNNSTNGGDGDWTELDSISSTTWSTSETKVNNVDTPASYTWYRLNFSNAPGGQIQIAEIDFMEVASRNNDSIIWDINNADTAFTLTNSDKTAVASALDDGSIIAELYHYFDGDNKYYFEVTIDQNTSNYFSVVGLDSSHSVTGRPATTDQWVYCSDGTKKGRNTSAAYGATFTTGDVIGVALDLDNKTLTFYKNGVSQGIAWSGRTWNNGLMTLRNLYPMAGADTNGAQSVQYTLALGSGDFAYSLPAGHIAWANTGAYVTGAPKYLTTSDTNQISLTRISTINSIDFVYSAPANTTLKTLVSFDGRSTWKTTSSGGGLSNFIYDLTNPSGWSTIENMETALSGTTASGLGSTLDIALQLTSSDLAATPYIDQITLNYDEPGIYKRAPYSNYNIKYVSDTQTSITRTVSGTKNLKVDVLI